jgi:hypothetical protein
MTPQQIQFALAIVAVAAIVWYAVSLERYADPSVAAEEYPAAYDTEPQWYKEYAKTISKADAHAAKAVAHTAKAAKAVAASQDAKADAHTAKADKHDKKARKYAAKADKITDAKKPVVLAG